MRAARPFLLLVGAMTLSACASDDEGEREALLAREVYPIILGAPGEGGGPAWRAVLQPGELLLDSPTSAGWYRIALPPPIQEPGPRRLTYEAGEVRLVGEIGACGIPAYRARLPNRMVLSWYGGTFEGCNGRGTLPERMDGTVWQLVRIGAEWAPEGRSPPATLIFGRDGGVGGTLACNDGGLRHRRWTPSGDFTGYDEGFEQTAMGCPDPMVDGFGRRFWSGMMTAHGWRREHARLYVTFADGTEAELRYLLAD
jgi:hypothetical protein